MAPRRPDRDWLVLGVLGLVVALGYGFLGIDLGGPALSSKEAWDHGVAQPYVASGLLLVVLAVLLRNGSTWVRWPILFWCPLTIIGGMAWASSSGVGKFDPIEFFVVAVPIMLGWLWGIRRMLFVRTKSLAP